MLLLTLFSVATLAVAVPQPVTELDAAAYLGVWYQTYASFTVKFTFQLGGNCVTAEYGATEVPAEEGIRGATVSVLHTVRLYPKLRMFFSNMFTGVRISGLAVQSSTTEGALEAFLGPIANDPAAATFNRPGNYWIIALGPIVKAKYDWAVVSGSEQETLHILTRDPERFKCEYEADVLAMVEEMGFTNFFNKPRPTNQEGCNYELD
jgi:lipocalin